MPLAKLNPLPQLRRLLNSPNGPFVAFIASACVVALLLQCSALWHEDRAQTLTAYKHSQTAKMNLHREMGHMYLVRGILIDLQGIDRDIDRHQRWKKSSAGLAHGLSLFVLAMIALLFVCILISQFLYLIARTLAANLRIRLDRRGYESFPDEEIMGLLTRFGLRAASRLPHAETFLILPGFGPNAESVARYMEMMSAYRVRERRLPNHTLIQSRAH